MEVLTENAPFIIFDVEYTAWEGSLKRKWTGKGEYPEVIQIGAVKLDPRQNHSEVESVELLVKPNLNPNLSEYITNLTGITDEMLDAEGVSFASALEAFSAFCESKLNIYSFGYDELMLLRNCKLNDIEFPFELSRFRDLEGPIKDQLGLGRSVVSSDLVDLLDLDVPGRRHTALTDARILAESLRALIQNKSPSRRVLSKK